MSGYENTGPWTGLQVDALLTKAGTALQPTATATFTPGTGPSQTASAGAELLTNASFATDLTGWTATNWTWSSGSALHTTGNTSALSQSVAGIVSGSLYQIVVTISGRTAGTVTLAIGAATYGASLSATTTVALAAAASGTLTFAITPTSDFDGKIDDVSLKLLTACSPLATLKNSTGTVTVEYRGEVALFNQFAGIDSGAFNTTGSYNVANGYQALRNTTTGNSNVANGDLALYSNTTGSNNIANGYQALRFNTTGNSNVANGYLALYSNTTGSSNVANGYLALNNTTTGTSNVANGYLALRFNTTGSSNVASGSYSLYDNTTGTSNVANGYQALRFNTTGVGNVANGYQALYSNTTGAYNVAYGYPALRYTNAGAEATTCSTCTAIGYDTRVAANGDTNETVIGNAARGQGSNTVAIGNSSVTGNYVYGDIESLTVGAGIILKSPDGTRYRITVANGGILEVSEA